MGFKVSIVTNAPRERAEMVESLTNGKIKVFGNMKKPSTSGIRNALFQTGSKPSTTVMIGDLFLTDILAGNKLGLYTILIKPYTFNIHSKYKKVTAFMSTLLYKIFFYTIGWIFRLIDLGVPNEFKKNIYEIDYEKLKETNHKLIIFDYDNTLVPWHSENLSGEVVDFFVYLKNLGFDILIASNGRDSRFDSVKDIIKNIDIKIQTLSLKPLKYKIQKKIKSLGYEPVQCVLVGDQLFTDIVSGTYSGFYTIKVEPLSENEGKWTHFVRNFERLSLKMMRERPKINREE